MRCKPLTAAKEKAYFLLKWMTLKSLGVNAHVEFQQPIIECDDGTWDIDHYLAVQLSSCDIYQSVTSLLSLEKKTLDFEALLETLAFLSGGRRVTLDLLFAENNDQDPCSPEEKASPDWPKRWKHGKRKRCVQLNDLASLPWSSELSHMNESTELLAWISAHVAVIEVILRIYLSQQITQKRLVDALSTVIGCRTSSNSLDTLQGADGALFWLVVVAARTVSLLGILDCSDWLRSHLLEQTQKTYDDSLSSGASYTAGNSDTMDSAADRFLRGMAMANLLALAFHFYHPDLAPEEDFYFNFSPGGDLEPAASHHNARTVAAICRAHPDELHSVLALMPPSCYEVHDDPETHRRSVTLNHVMLLGFCSQGLARSPAHRRLQNATLAAEVFFWVSKQAPDRQIPPIHSGRPRIHQTSSSSSAVSHSSRRQLNESNVIHNHTQTSTATTATKPFHPGSGHATTPSPVRAHLHRPGTPRTPSECFTPLHQSNATLSPQSPTGRETYRLSEHDAAPHGHKLGGDEKTTLEADRVSRDRPSTQAGQHTSQNGLGQSVINTTHHHQQQQSAGAIDVSAVNGGVFYAPTICTSESGASEPFRLVEHAEFHGAFSPQSAVNQNSRDPLHMIFHQQCSPPENVTVATSLHRKTPSDFHQPVGLRKVRAVWGTPNRANRSHSVCSPPSTTTNVNRNGQQLDISSKEKKIGSKQPQKKFTYTSDETDSIFIRDISINSGSPLPTSDENEDVKSLAHRSMVDLPGNYPRRTRIKSPPTRALVNKTSRVPSDNRAPDLLYKLKQADPESTDVNETDPGDDLCSPSEHPRACELDCTNHASSAPHRTRWKRSSERRLSDTRPHRSSSRRIYRSSRSTKREESTPVFYYPTGGIYPQPVRAEHCVVPVMYPVESSASPRQMYAIHCDPYCPQSSWIHPPPHHHLPPQHPLNVMPPNPFVSPSQYYVGPTHPAHTQIVGSLVNSTSVPQMPIDPEYCQANSSYATIPRTISSGPDLNDMVQHTNNTVEHNTCSSEKPDESITIDSQTVNRIRPDSTQPTDGDENKRTPDEALPTRSPDVNNSRHQRAQSFFVSIESGKVGSQPAFGLRGPSLRSTSLVRRRETKPKLPTTDDVSQVTSSTGPSQTRVEGNESDFDQVKPKPNRTNEESDSGKNSNSEKCPKPVTETSKTVTERSAPGTSSPRPLVRTHSSESNIPLKLSVVTDQIEKREQRRELERQRREAIFQAYLNRKTSASSDRETDNSLPSSASLSQNSSVKRKTPRITERARLTDSSPRQAHKQRSSLLTRRPASLSRSTINSTREVNGESKGQARDELSLLRIKSPTSADLPPVGPNQMEPKLFVELKSKSNRRVISNALSHCCLAGPVNEEAKHAALEALGCSDGKHFMILLRSQCQYGGLYSYSTTEDQAVRVSGNGPKKINNNMVAHYYKYDSGSKRFSEITSTSHLSTVVDAVQLHGRTRNRLTSGSAVV